jgi:hypothetical protein
MSAYIVKYMNNFPLFFCYIISYLYKNIKYRRLLQYLKKPSINFHEKSLGILAFFMYLKICIFCTISHRTLKDNLRNFTVPRNPGWGNIV